jgi:glycolate oxidase FAD binding subunit
VAAVRAPSIDPSAIELTLSGDDAEIAVLVEGSAAGVAARAEALRRALGVPDAVVTDTPPPWWGTYPFAAREIGLRLAVAVSSVPAAIAVLLDRLGGRVTIRGSVGTGVLHAGVPVTVPADDLGAALRGVRALLPASGGGCVVLTAPASVKEGLDLWGPVPGIGLMRRIKAQFDPAGRFAPGRFVGGI